MRVLARTTMRTVSEIMQEQGITTPVMWVAAIHDDHTDKRYIHALAALQGRLDESDVDRIGNVLIQLVELFHSISKLIAIDE